MYGRQVEFEWEGIFYPPVRAVGMEAVRSLQLPHLNDKWRKYVSSNIILEGGPHECFWGAPGLVRW